MSDRGIDIWYSDEQSFGEPGLPQRWINILGTVSPANDVTALSYVINDSEPQSLNVGSDHLRLWGVGDFNIEIPIESLQDGTHNLQITATFKDGSSVTKDVAVHFSNAAAPQLPLTIDWSEVASITDVAQVVNGPWRLTPDGIRPDRMAYDRAVAIGDHRWRDYRATVRIIMHSFERPEDLPSPNDSIKRKLGKLYRRWKRGLKGGVGIMFHWTGHYPDEHQPHREWRPSGLIAWYRARWENQRPRHRTLNLSDGVQADLMKVESGPVDLNLEQPYVFQYTRTTDESGTGHYQLRVWPEDSPETILCNLSVPGSAGEPANGSVLLIAHHADVTIGRVVIEPI